MKILQIFSPAYWDTVKERNLQVKNERLKVQIHIEELHIQNDELEAKLYDLRAKQKGKR